VSAYLRTLFGLVFAAFALAGCGGSGPSFKNTDITGADYGRDFALTDHTGKARTLADFRGKAVVMFFGYTRCPDVCPTTLAELKTVREQLGEDGKRLQVLFVTVDPERDTQKLLASYVPAFDPSFLGLYGDSAATARSQRTSGCSIRSRRERHRTAIPWITRRAATSSIRRGACACSCVTATRPTSRPMSGSC